MTSHIIIRSTVRKALEVDRNIWTPMLLGASISLGPPPSRGPDRLPPGMRPTETRHSPELRQERRERQAWAEWQKG